MPERFDVVVVGAGHAGCEAALAAARMGARVLLLTQNLDTIGAMSCNPSIGGVAKGQLVRELDALGGEMARNTDRSAILYQTLNLSKGRAMHSPRAQCDKKLYALSMKEAVEAQAGLLCVQDEAAGLLLESGRAAGVLGRRGERYEARAVVLTTGTFLNGLAHVGLQSFPAGRAGDAPAAALSSSLRELGFALGRMKTGTPMRLHARSIDYSACERQDGDASPRPFSHFHERITQPQRPCWITYTSPAAHEVIRGALDRSPLYSGVIQSVGPRYCPSIEDKVVKFPHKERHQIFLEPEGLRTQEVYVNGLSTSLPQDVQRALVRAVAGLERAEIVRYGYAVEYDYCPPTQLERTLETKLVPGLFFAGQLNGTTGYEEAAGQGLLAGVNAVLRGRGEGALALSRADAYLGVLVDDLVTKGVDEPYRMFTSRAEHRLSLRADNADLRLLATGRRLGLIGPAHWDAFRRYREAVELGREFPAEQLAPWSMDQAREQREIQESYSGYIEREQKSAARLKDLDEVELPELDYASIPSLPNEARQKLSRIRPATLGQAGRIPGVSPSDVQIVAVFAARARRAAGSSR